MESNDPKAYPGVWRGDVEDGKRKAISTADDDIKVCMNCGNACRGTFCDDCRDADLPPTVKVDRIVEGNKTTARDLATKIYMTIKKLDHGDAGDGLSIINTEMLIHADRIKVVEMCREAIDESLSELKSVLLKSVSGSQGIINSIDLCVDVAFCRVKDKIK